MFCDWAVQCSPNARVPRHTKPTIALWRWRAPHCQWWFFTWNFPKFSILNHQWGFGVCLHFVVCICPCVFFYSFYRSNAKLIARKSIDIFEIVNKWSTIVSLFYLNTLFVLFCRIIQFSTWKSLENVVALYSIGK